MSRASIIIRGPVSLMRIAWHQGLKQVARVTSEKLSSRYPRLARFNPIHESFPPAVPSNSSSYLPLLKYRPKISIIITAYNSHWLPEAMESVFKQSYDNYEVVIVNDASTYEKGLKDIASYEGHPRVKVVHNQHNMGISHTTNNGINASDGEFIAFMDHDDLIHPDALALMVRHLNLHPETDIFFTDEVIIDTAGRVIGKMNKCPISMDLLLSVNAVNHFCVMRRSELDRIGLLRPEYDGSQDLDLMLRALESGLKFTHLPIPLYAWRVHQRSYSQSTMSADKQGYTKAYIAAKKAIGDYLKRNDVQGTVTDDAFHFHRVKYALPDVPAEVAIVVPFKDQLSHLKTLLNSLKLTSYKHYRLYLVDNRSEKKETLQFLSTIDDPRIEILKFNEPFNYSRLHNVVVRQLTQEFVLFLNNDIEIVEPDWLDALLEHGQRPGVGAVGAKLFFPDGGLQHGGIVFRPSVYFCSINLYQEQGYYTLVQRDVSGVTAACMLIKRSVFLELGGFDEVHFPIGFSDADLCLRLKQAGYKIMYTPHAKLVHHESASRRLQGELYEKYMLFSRHAGDSPMVDQHYPLP